MTLHSGWDSFMPAPGTHDRMQCRVCEEDMEVHRNVNGPTSMAESMAKRGHLHDHFVCKYANEDWHRQVLSLKRRQEEEPSTAIKEIIEAEIVQIVVQRKPSEGWKPTWRDI